MHYVLYLLLLLPFNFVYAAKAEIQFHERCKNALSRVQYYLGVTPEEGVLPYDHKSRLSLRTPRLTITPIDSNNIDAVIDISTKPDVFDSMFPKNTPRPSEERMRDTMNDAAKNVEDFKDNKKSFTLAIQWQNKPIGSVSVYRLPDRVLPPIRKPNERWLSIGYFVDPEFQGRGYATEAIQRVINLIKSSNLGDVVFAMTDNNNQASAKVLEKLGFKEIDTPFPPGSRKFMFRVDKIQSEEERSSP